MYDLYHDEAEETNECRAYDVDRRLIRIANIAKTAAL